MLNANAFCADYSAVTSCMTLIQSAKKNGDFNNYPEVLTQLNVFENDLLRKLYVRVVTILGKLNGQEGFPSVNLDGDFEELDFEELDFWIGFASNHTSGDFWERNFFELDFWTGFAETDYDNFASVFQTILNIFSEFCQRSSELNDYERALVDASLIPLLDAFADLKDLLGNLGISPCDDIENNHNNSNQLFLQAAGSVGDNGIVEGCHLRWTFLGDLGENHLPKGNYFANAANLTGYNRTNDFVKLERTAFTDLAGFNLNLELVRPVINSAKRIWTYTLNTVHGDIRLSNQVRFHFLDSEAYYNLAGIVNPSQDFFGFLNAYTGRLEIKVPSKDCFHFGISVNQAQTGNPGSMKLEALSQLGSEMVSVRKTAMVYSSPLWVNLEADNMKSFMLKKEAGLQYKEISFQTYHDFEVTRSSNAWEVISEDLALSTTDVEVYDRLENSLRPIDNLWPQFNEGTTVNAQNYRSRWSGLDGVSAEESLKQLLELYLQLSISNPKALYTLPETAVSGGQTQTVSLLDMIHLQTMDYHVARMFGLGYIDGLPGIASDDRFVYRLSYSNLKKQGTQQVVTHLYYSLPTSKNTSRLPEKPVMRPVTYNAYTVTGPGDTAFDDRGYAKFDQLRAVNIGRTLHQYEEKDDDFFEDLTLTDQYNPFQQTQPVSYGVEYRPHGQADYVKPEITADHGQLGKIFYAHDVNYPSTGIPEVNPVPDDPLSLFVHFERTNGIHYYAIYGINWFSRASPLSDEQATDETLFVPPNLLAAPTDLQVQYIQPEEQLVFTSSREQSWLTGRRLAFPGQDINLTRVTFNWLDIADVSHLQQWDEISLNNLPRANQVNLFFRPTLMQEVLGVIADVAIVAGDDGLLKLHAGKYGLLTGEEVSPAIAVQDAARFIGGVLSTPEGQFQVMAVEIDLLGMPVITIAKDYKLLQTEDPQSPGVFSATKKYLAPMVGSRFSMVENLGKPENWSALNAKIPLLSLANTAQPVLETVSSEGGDSKFWIGGLHGEALINQVLNDQGEFDGYYEITFGNEVTLPPHPQVNLPFDPSNSTANQPGANHPVHVEWFNGLLRMADKMLPVVALESLNPVKLYVYDADLSNPPLGTAQILVNYHPGYRIYAFAEVTPSLFKRDNILPVGEANDKRSLLTAQTEDVSRTGFTSPLSTPAVLLARKIYELRTIEAPLAGRLRVRPDMTRAAAFTFDINSPNGADPFGFLFYRTSNKAVLEAFYEATTVTSIISDLSSLTEDPSFEQRYLDLVNLKFDVPGSLDFKSYPATPQAYGFPAPDKIGLFQPNDDYAARVNRLEIALHNTLLPLTEQPVIYRFIKNTTQTSNDFPVIKDLDGNLLASTDARFNPFPMAGKYTKDGIKKVRFTDYHLRSSYRDFYFYAAAEIDNTLKIGVLSSFVGPVEVLATDAAKAPLINSFGFILPSFLESGEGSVQLTIASVPASDQITLFRVYRSLELNSEGQLLNPFAFDVPLGTISTEGYQIVDQFKDLAVMPWGRTAYYQVVGVRYIQNEFDEQEEVLSRPTPIVSVRTLDTKSPEAPELHYNEVNNSLSWSPTVYNGKYRLFKQNKRANWEQIISYESPVNHDNMTFTLPMPLDLQDEDGDRIYHRFKVQVENAAGRFNLTDKELTI